MTKQNVVVSDDQSAIAVALTAAVKDSSLFPPAVPTSPAKTPGGYPYNITLFSRNKLSKNLEMGTGDGGAEINAWVDAMRASSPARKSFSGAGDRKSWIMKHPSALNVFEEIMKASKTKKIAIFLDYDGTLSPIVENPDQAFMAPEMREAVKNVAKYFPTTIVSGRSRAKVYKFVRLSELYYAGSHGMDIKGPSTQKHQKGNQSVLCQPAKDFLPMMDEVYKVLLEKTKSISGANVENNKFCLSIHFRCVQEKKWNDLAECVKSVIENYPKLHLTQGRKVLEIRPTVKWDKGKALEFLLESLGYADSNDVFPLYIGDDRTDEDAFKVLRNRGQGIGILVSKVPKETNATYSLQEPSEVMCFLQRLVAWRRSLPRGY